MQITNELMVGDRSMGSHIIGRRPNPFIQAAICTSSECEERGQVIEVPSNQQTYTCSCGQVIQTFRFNKFSHDYSAEQVARERDAEINSTVRWCYAPQLNLDKDGGEPL